jgi:HSP20 family protein
MAETRSQNTQGSTGSQTPQTTTTNDRERGSSAMSRRDRPGTSLSPFISPFGSLFSRWNAEMDRLFEDFGIPTYGRGITARQHSQWMPQIEVTQRGNDLLVRADLPGIKKDDVHVDIADNVLTIQGERRDERQEEREGWHRSEFSYGTFHRAIPLPEGAITDNAKASFKDGVLEVVIPAPPKEVSQGRSLPIS